MYEVATMEMPQRSLLCLKRNVSEPGLWALGKEFAGIVRDQGIDPKQLSLTPEGPRRADHLPRQAPGDRDEHP